MDDIRAQNPNIIYARGSGQGDKILADLGLDWDTIVDLKVRGVVA